VVHLAIDDTLTLGASSSVRGQCWVSLAMDQAPLARPRWSRLIPVIRISWLRPRPGSGIKIRVLVDSWYLRRTLIQSMLEGGLEVIGPVVWWTSQKKDKTKRLTQKVWSQIDTETDRPLKEKVYSNFNWINSFLSCLNSNESIGWYQNLVGLILDWL